MTIESVELTAALPGPGVLQLSRLVKRNGSATTEVASSGGAARTGRTRENSGSAARGATIG